MESQLSVKQGTSRHNRRSGHFKDPGKWKADISVIEQHFLIQDPGELETNSPRPPSLKAGHLPTQKGLYVWKA